MSRAWPTWDTNTATMAPTGRWYCWVSCSVWTTANNVKFQPLIHSMLRFSSEILMVRYKFSLICGVVSSKYEVIAIWVSLHIVQRQIDRDHKNKFQSYALYLVHNSVVWEVLMGTCPQQWREVWNLLIYFCISRPTKSRNTHHE